MNRTAKIEASLAGANFKNLEADLKQLSVASATMLVGGTSSVFHKHYSINEAIAAVRESVAGIEATQ